MSSLLRRPHLAIPAAFALGFLLGSGGLLLSHPGAGAHEHGGLLLDPGLPPITRKAKAPGEDWWAELERYHGSVQPWNVFGWRVAQHAMKHFGTEWGEHDLVFLVATPARTPLAGIADGLSVGSGNSLGSLDLALAPAAAEELIQVSVSLKDGGSEVLVYRPTEAFLSAMELVPGNDLEAAAGGLIAAPEEDLFAFSAVPVRGN